MKEFTCVVKDPIGIHARPAGLLVKEVKKFQSTVTVCKGDREADGLKLMRLMSLGVKNGETIVVKIDGVDEDEAVVALKKIFEKEL